MTLATAICAVEPVRGLAVRRLAKNCSDAETPATIDRPPRPADRLLMPSASQSRSDLRDRERKGGESTAKNSLTTHCRERRRAELALSFSSMSTHGHGTERPNDFMIRHEFPPNCGSQPLLAVVLSGQAKGRNILEIWNSD